MRRFLGCALVAVLAVGCAQPAHVDTVRGPSYTPAPAPATADHLPAGTVLQVRLTQPLGTAHSQVGDGFTAVLDLPVVAQNGQTVLPQGTTLHGRVTGLSPAGGPGYPAAMRLSFEGIAVRGVTHNFEANIVDTDVQVDDGDQLGRAIEHAVAGAAAGAVLGTILRGDLRAAGLGAAIGAGVGTVVSLGTGRTDANLPMGSRRTIQTARHIWLH
jgi:hypothetical protein